MEFGCILNPMTSVSIKEKQGTFTCRHTGVKAMWQWRQRLKWCHYKPRTPEIAGSHRRGKRGPSLEFEEHARPWGQLDFGFLASLSLREQISLVLSHQVSGLWWQQPEETNTSLFLERERFMYVYVSTAYPGIWLLTTFKDGSWHQEVEWFAQGHLMNLCLCCNWNPRPPLI